MLLWRSARNAIRTLRSALGTLVHYPPRVVVVTLRGVIATDDEIRTGMSDAMLAPALLPGHEELRGATMRGEQLINLGRFERTLTRAFATPGARAVALLIDSPGGSPAQSSLLHHRLKTLRERHPRVALLAFVEDSACSGGYYIACAADEIVADHNSIVGSIGVISRGFGYVRKLRKEGLERRVHVAGRSKSGLDPFMPIKANDLARQQRLLNELHQNFILAVHKGRGARLKPELAAALHLRTAQAVSWLPRLFTPTNSTIQHLIADGAGLFDGTVYSGKTALSLGLIDAIGEMRSELQRRYGKSVNLVRVAPEESQLDYSRLLRWLL